MTFTGAYIDDGNFTTVYTEDMKIVTIPNKDSKHYTVTSVGEKMQSSGEAVTREMFYKQKLSCEHYGKITV
jgi:hypothetical protein